MPLLTDDSLVRFEDRHELLEHVRHRGMARRRRVHLTRIGALSLALLLLGALPVLRLVGPDGSSLRTVPPAGSSKTGGGAGGAPRPTADQVGQPPPSAPHEESALAGTGPERDAAPGGQPARQPGEQSQPDAPPSPPPGSRHECVVNHSQPVGAGPGAFVGENPCHFTARSDGGYEALGQWQITITRDDSLIELSSADGDPACGPSGIFQPGDQVEVRVQNGRVAAGSAYGTDC